MKELESIKIIEEANKTGEIVDNINKNLLNIFIEKLNKGEEFKIESNGIIKKEFMEFSNSKLIGQEEAKEIIARALLNLNKIGDNEGVLSTLFFAGPTGVGKTELVKILAEFLTGDKNNFTFIQGAEYSEDFKVNNLFGSAKGYVGYDDPPILSDTNLFNKKIKKPHRLIENKEKFTIILVDEAEKIHPKIIQSLLGVLNEGKVILPTGKEDSNKKNDKDFSKETDLRNTIWIFTSNIGAKNAEKNKENKGIGFIQNNGKDDSKKIYKKEYEDFFSPEFRGRIDYFVLFNELNDNDINKIIDLRIQHYNNNLKKYMYENIEVEISNKLKSFLKGKVNKKLGARNLVKILNKIIENKISELESENILSTLKLAGLKSGKKAKIIFLLKDNYKDYKNDLDKIKLVIKGEDDTRIGIKDKKEVEKYVENLNKNKIQENNNFPIIRNFNNSFNSISFTEAFYITKKEFIQILSKREKAKKDYISFYLKLYDYILNNLSEKDLTLLNFIGYYTIIKEFKESSVYYDIEDVKKIISKIENFLGLLNINNKDFSKLLKNKIRKFKKQNPYNKLLESLEKIENIKLTRKEKVIISILYEIEKNIIENNGYLLDKDSIDSLYKYLAFIYRK